MRIGAPEKQSQNKPNSKPIKANFRQEMPKMPYLPACVKRHYAGTVKAMQPGTCFSGLIDDVRIYDVALSAAEIETLAR